MTVGAVIVTRDREALLRECLAAVLGQTRVPDEVIVVDNASSDGTAAFLAEKTGQSRLFHVVRLERNDGSAGGFAAGVAEALERGHDRLWLLDDDTIPSPTALEALLEAPEADLLCSRVVWTDGTPHPMNAPWPRFDPPEAMLGAIDRGLLAVRAATYVSILVSRAAVERRGGPKVPFFVWGDDVEFTARLLRDGTGYYVPSSVVVHKTATNYAASLSTSDRYAFDVRNKVWMWRADDVWAPAEKTWWALLGLANAKDYLRHNRFRPRAWLIVLRGLWQGLASSPS